MKDSGRRISHPAIEFLLLRWNAEKLFGEFLKPAQAKVFRLTHPRLRIDLRLGERHHKGVNGGGSLLSDKTPPRRSQIPDRSCGSCGGEGSAFVAAWPRPRCPPPPWPAVAMTAEMRKRVTRIDAGGSKRFSISVSLLLFLSVIKRALSAFAPIVLFAFLLEKLPSRMKFHLPVCCPGFRENLRIIVGQLIANRIRSSRREPLDDVQSVAVIKHLGPARFVRSEGPLL